MGETTEAKMVLIKIICQINNLSEWRMCLRPYTYNASGDSRFYFPINNDDTHKSPKTQILTK